MRDPVARSWLPIRRCHHNLLCMAALIAVATNAESALTDRGGGLIYDDVLDVTWLIDANYASSTLTVERVDEIVARNRLIFSDGHALSRQDFFLTANTQGADNPGLMNWWGAMAWVDQLAFHDVQRDRIYTGWRLPEINPIGSVYNTAFSNDGSSDLGYGSIGTESELNHMFYANLSNLGICLPVGNGVADSCVTQPGWGLVNTGPFVNLLDQTYWSANEYGLEVWAFDFGVGFQGLKTETNRNNQLLAWPVHDGDIAAFVPLPAAAWLFASGLLVLAVRWMFGAIPIRISSKNTS